MNIFQLLSFGVLLACQVSVIAATNTAVIIVSGGAAVSPFTTPNRACKTGFAAGSTDTFMRQFLIEKGYRVFTSPAMTGNGPVMAEAGDEAGPFSDCPPSLPDRMTVNSTGDIQLAGVHLAKFVEYLRRQHGIHEVHFVAHSMGGLYSRSAVQYLQQKRSKIKVLSLTTLGTPWQGTYFANPPDPKDPASGCDGQKICLDTLEAFGNGAPVVMVEMSRLQMALLNKYSEGVLRKVPVTMIGGNAFTKSGGDPGIWPNDGIVDLGSAFAQNLSDQVVEHRRCHRAIARSNTRLPLDRPGILLNENSRFS